MTGWLVRITAIIIATTCAEMVLPSGRTKITCKTVLSLVCIVVLVEPIASIKNLDYSFSDMFEEYVQQDYVEEVNSYYCSMYENEIENLLNSEGISCDKCMVIGKLNNKTFVVDEIIVDIKKSGIQTEDGHIIDIEEIKKLLCDMLSVSADMVCVNER